MLTARILVLVAVVALLAEVTIAVPNLAAFAECDFFLDTIAECNGVYRKADEYDYQLNRQFEDEMRAYYNALARHYPAVRPKFPNFCRYSCGGNGIDDFRRLRRQ